MRHIKKPVVTRYRERGLLATIEAGLRYTLRSLLAAMERRELKKLDMLRGSYREGDPRLSWGSSGENNSGSEIFETLKYVQSLIQSQTYPVDQRLDFDVITVTDTRFPGGSTSSTVEEILTQSRSKLRSGLYHLPSFKMRFRDAPSPKIKQLIDDQHVILTNGLSGRLKAKVLLFRHPSILNPDGAPLPEMDADEVILIVNHPPIKFGSIEYLLPDAIRKLRNAYGCDPKVFPIGPLVRDAIAEAYDGTVKIEKDDWVNIFDISRFQFERPFPSGRRMRIGRHSRPNKEKWPARAEDILAAYPESDDMEVHILGGADIPTGILGRTPENWVVHQFGDIDAAEFLKTIDIFVYFHHPDWIEAFGRVIVEAMASGLPTVLPHHFEPLFEDAALYCSEDGVGAMIDFLRIPENYADMSARARHAAVRRFSADVHRERLRYLGVTS